MKEKAIEFLKFIFFLLFLPLIVNGTIAFIDQLDTLPQNLRHVFLQGILIYLIFYLFIYEFEPVYQYGQNLVMGIFRFFAPLVRVAPFVLPIFSILFLILFYFSSVFLKSEIIRGTFMFLVSLTLTMHMVFTSKSLRGQDSNAVKPNYLFAFSLIYVVNIFILSLMLDLIFPEFSFYAIFKFATQRTGQIYGTIFRQLFVP